MEGAGQETGVRKWEWNEKSEEAKSEK